MSARINDSQSVRYGLIDAVRGLAIVNMIAFHLCYDIFSVFGSNRAIMFSTWAVIWERLIGCTFIIVSGMAMNFSRRGYKRGIAVNLCGFAITAVTVLLLPSESIWFGILNLLGCAMIITFALRDPLNKSRPAVGAAVSLLLFAVFDGLPAGYLGFFRLRLIELPSWLYGCRYLAFIGLPSKDFYSSDYFPLLPWIFLFIFGYYLWRLIEEKGLQGFFEKKIPALGLIGRHSLIIYLAHQPVLYGICRLILGQK